MCQNSECTTLSMNHNVNYKPWVTIMYQCRLINYYKCNPLMGDVGNGGGYSPVQARGTWDISVSFSQFFCEPKTALKD